mgnify:FL=1
MLRIAENAIHGLVAADSRVNGGQTGGRIPCMLLLSLVLPAYLLAGLPASVRERILWVRPEFSKICRSVDLIFSPAPCGCRAFFVSARGVVFWILMRALRFVQGSRIESDHPRAVRGVVRFACGACGNHSAQVQNKNDSHSRRGRASKLPCLSDRLPGVSLRLWSVRDRLLSSDAS